MKLFGNSSKAKHSGKARGSGHAAGTHGGKHLSAKSAKKHTVRNIIITVIVVIAALVIAGFAIWKSTVKPPEVSETKRVYPPSWSQKTENPDAGEETELPDDNTEEPEDGRSGGKYTFAVLGTDDGNGNTDTIMIVNFDTESYKLSIVSIPRDTMVNVSWNTKKVNSLYGVGGVERSMEGLADILGFDLDFYVIVNLTAFEKLVDAIGGVYYDVPVNMNYNDPAQNLYISISKGPQTLSGSEAVKVMRFRKGYANADIGRIGTQQDFLMTVAEQLMENKSKLNLSTLADVFLNYVKTDLTYGNLVWFAQEFFKMDMENITFMTLPGNYLDSVNGNSYVSIYVNDWLEMINEYLNPYDDDVELSDLNILTRDPNTKKIYSTSGSYAGKSSWGNTSSPSSSKPSTPSTPSPSPSPEPEEPTEETPVEDPIEEIPIGEPIEELPVEDPIEELPIEDPIEEMPAETPSDGPTVTDAPPAETPQT